MTQEDRIVDASELIQDDHNFNKGTEEGDRLLRESLEKYGAGRSMLIDRDNRIIAGNKTQRKAQELGMKVRIVETDADTIIAVKRTDVSLDSKEGREMALLDNLTTQKNLDWNEAEIADVASQYDIDTNEWDIATPEIGESDAQPQTDAKDVKELKLVFTPEQYSFVLSQLRKYGDDFTKSLLQILNIHE